MAHIKGNPNLGQTALSSAATDEQRARELYKYFRPFSTAPASPDTVLTAYTQLVAWKLNAQRAMISLIDEDMQYFVAEGTKTLHLDNVLCCDHPDDAIWAGCIQVPKAGRLCEHTIAMPQPTDGGPAYFEVLNLANDARFNALDFVAGPPFFKHYVGVPLRTRKGINIGSLFVLNCNDQQPLTDTQRHFLGVMAANVMQHLEMIREKKDNQRSAHMTACLSIYINPYHEGPSHEGRPSSCSDFGKTTTQTTPKHMPNGLERGKIYTRAAEALKDAMAMEQDGGGIAFLDTLGPISSDHFCPEYPNNGHQPPQITENSAQCKAPYVTQIPGAARLAVAEVLAHTGPDELIANPSIIHRPCFMSLSTENLSKLIEHHPRGKMFTFDKYGQMDSDSSNDQSLPDEPFKRYNIHRTAASKEDADMLRTHFPMARQIIFIPLWDSITSRYTACFVYNNSAYQYFSYKLEFLHSITFINCVVAEIARSANQLVSHQKSDFMGSVSHELRSPLHGILASCEMLADTRITSFQQSLLHTADSCAKTLLDIVNMVLDYSKINRSEQSLGKFQGTTRNPHSDGQKSAIQSSLSAFQNFDLAILVEDVVEGVATGYAYEKALSAVHNLTDVNICDGKLSSKSNISSRKAQVELVLDISKENWIYWSEPGAIRRIVMNLVGNSLKYTMSGFVHVQLATQKSTLSLDSKNASYVILTITDTGQGISPAYLENKLFTPFAQESDLTPGTGLGLSLVKLLVSKLDGNISVHSSVGVGTRIVVKIPMARNMPIESHCIDREVNANLGSIAEHKGVDIVGKIKADANKKTIAIIRNNSARPISCQNQTSFLLHDTLARYLSNWLGFKVCEWHEKLHPDIIIIDEAELKHLINANPHLSAFGCRTVLLVVYSIASAHTFKDGAITGHANLEFVRHPLGPNKLAKALNICLERLMLANNCGPVVAEVPHRTVLGQAIQSPIEATMPSAQSELTGPRDPSIGVATLDEQQVDLPTVDAYHNSTPRALTMERSLIDSIVATSPLNLSPIVPIMPEKQEVFDSPGTHPDSSCAVGEQEFETCMSPTKRLPRMLLVDDNKINLRILQVCMAKRKYVKVNTAEHGLQAVNIYRQLLFSTPSTPPDIVLMDISMPVMDGIEATRQIRKMEAEYSKKLPLGEPARTALIIAVTGLASVRDQKAAFSGGVDMYIMKPVSIAKLSQLLASWEAKGKEAMLQDTPRGLEFTASHPAP